MARMVQGYTKHKIVRATLWLLSRLFSHFHTESYLIYNILHSIMLYALRTIHYAHANFDHKTDFMLNIFLLLSFTFLTSSNGIHFAHNMHDVE